MKILEAEYKSSLEREREAADEPDDLPDLVWVFRVAKMFPKNFHVGYEFSYLSLRGYDL